MSELERALSDPERAALGRLLSHELSEERERRLWQRIERRGESRPAPVWVGGAAAAAAFTIVVAGWLLWFRLPARSALKLASGETPVVLESPETPRAVALADGSAIELGRGTRLEVLRNDERSFVTVLRRGSSKFEVRPGGPRRWIVEAGLLTAEVTGTRFSVQRGASSARVSVEDGVVTVRSERLPGGSTELTAGTSVEVEAPLPERAAAPAPPAPSTQSRPLDQPGTPPKPAPMPAGESVRDPVDELLSAADAARRGGDTAAAIQKLERAIAIAPPRDPRRGMAALSLARLTVEADPERASKILEDAVGDMPEALAEDALARRVQAEARAGRVEAAERLAQEYLRRFPKGHRADEVRRWSRP